ncbi:hypothetical protein [Methylobacterium oryzihabitans]|uniref:Uncharacterized protein n=1 Tax=Methylobacterium oryzihabitans TaxID=2499852 RepID=A0A437NSY2_9HYPH|nr:hypothetical protein [Methylobacterium oryzihabitans]RVU13146.1 hypothetical protein EOE48_26930 [Methylobacterium oryzihabitans]
MPASAPDVLTLAFAAAGARPVVRHLASHVEGPRAPRPAPGFSGLLDRVRPGAGAAEVGRTARLAIDTVRRARAGAEAVLPEAPVPAPVPALPGSVKDALGGYSAAQLYAHAREQLLAIRSTLEYAEDLASGRHLPRPCRATPLVEFETPACIAEFVATTRVRHAQAEAVCRTLALCIGREAVLGAALEGEGT